MNKVVLLREYYSLCTDGQCYDLLTEEEKRDVRENNAIYFTGIFQKADEKNGNGRIYPRGILEREVNNFQKLIRERRALGELDHPDDSVVNLKNASHMVKELWWDGNTVMGKAKVLSGEPGQQLRSLINDGVSIGMSSRGLGSVREEDGGTIVEDDFGLITFDVVSEPSTTGAYMTLQENQAKRIYKKADRINRLLNRITEGR